MVSTAIAPPRRLFVGLMPDRQVQAAIQRHARAWEWPAGARPTRFGRFHMTLHFLGDVGLAPELRLRQALRDVPAPPLELHLCLPQGWRNGVAVLCPADHEGLQALHRRIAPAVAAAGLEPARQFAPHITLARNAANALPPEAMRPIRWRVDEFVLVWSLLWPAAKPARYEIVERFGDAAGKGALQPPAPSGQAGEQFSL